MTTAASDDTRLALESLLRWYAAMGVDAAVDEAPHDRFAAPPPRPREVESRPKDTSTRMAPAKGAPSRPEPPSRSEAIGKASAEELVRLAESRAAEAGDLDALREAFATQPGLGLSSFAKMIFADGTQNARLMVIGAAPEADDERGGAAFAGPHGKLLDGMLRAIDLDRASAYLAYVVPWRPPGNRVASPLELSLCLPYTRRHIALAAPEAILCLGERAAQPLLGSRDPISRLRGRWLAYEGDGATTKLLATFSLGYLLSQPLEKRSAWADLRMMMAALRATDEPPDP